MTSIQDAIAPPMPDLRFRQVHLDFHTSPLIRLEAPTTVEVPLLRQPSSAVGASPERLVCHLLHYVPQRRTPDLDLVEDILPLYDLPLAVRTRWTPREVYLAPERDPLPVTVNRDYARVRVPCLPGHAMVVLER